MENLTLTEIKDFAVVTLAILAFIVLLGNAIKAIKDWKKPGASTIWKKGTG